MGVFPFAQLCPGYVWYLILSLDDATYKLTNCCDIYRQKLKQTNALMNTFTTTKHAMIYSLFGFIVGHPQCHTAMDYNLF